MKVCVQFRVAESITEPDDVKKLRRAFGKQMEKLQQSGKLVDGGMLGDRRGGYLILNIEKSADLYDLLGGVFYDTCSLEVSPVISLEELKAFFEKESGASWKV